MRHTDLDKRHEALTEHGVPLWVGPPICYIRDAYHEFVRHHGGRHPVLLHEDVGGLGQVGCDEQRRCALA